MNALRCIQVVKLTSAAALHMTVDDAPRQALLIVLNCIGESLNAPGRKRDLIAIGRVRDGRAPVYVPITSYILAPYTRNVLSGLFRPYKTHLAFTEAIRRNIITLVTARCRLPRNAHYFTRLITQVAMLHHLVLQKG